MMKKYARPRQSALAEQALGNDLRGLRSQTQGAITTGATRCAVADQRRGQGSQAVHLDGARLGHPREGRQSAGTTS